MICFRLIIAFIMVKTSLILAFPVGSPLLNSRQERAESCSFFDVDSSCLSSPDSSFSVATADGEEGLSSDGTASGDDFFLSGPSGQISLMDDLSMPTSDSSSIAAENLHPNFSQSQVAKAALKTDSNVLLDNVPEELITEHAETIFTYSSDAGEISQSSRPLPVIYSYICEEYAETCAQYKDGVATGVTRYAKCNNDDRKCRLCDMTGRECDPDSGWDRQAIPSPDNETGQPWNHCRNKKCGACENAARMLGFLSLGVIPGCGPPIFN